MKLELGSFKFEAEDDTVAFLLVFASFPVCFMAWLIAAVVFR